MLVVVNTAAKKYAIKDSLIKLAKYYNTSIDYLLCLTDERKPYPRSILQEK